MSTVPAILRPVDIPGAPLGPLSGLRFAVKDVIDVAGIPTTAGSRAWPDSHPTPQSNATAVDMLLAAGASLVGKAISDELAFSINGTNPHHGTPRNPAAPDRMPGGSSSGSASAVAAGDCDLALGTDTGGSIRVPASYCGLFGIRPTWGRIPLAGVTALSPSFDTLGWMARDARTLHRVGEVLLAERSAQPPAPAVLVPVAEGLELADDDVAAELSATLRGLFPGRVRPVRRLGADLREWARVRYMIQTHETWRLHGAWVAEHADRLGSGVGARLLACADTTREQYDRACADRAAISALLDDAVGPDEVLVLPSAPAPAPLLAAPPEALARQRDRVFPLMAPAALWGGPQVSVPGCSPGGLPVGLGLMARPHSDLALLDLLASGGLASGGDERSP
jgi:amidase